MSELGEVVLGEGCPLGDPTPPVVPLDAGPGHEAHHEPLDLGLLDEVNEGIQRLAVAPPSPKSKRLRDFKILVNAQNENFRKSVLEA